MIWLAKNWKVVAVFLLMVSLMGTGWKLYRAGAERATLAHRLQVQQEVSASLMVRLATQNAALEAHSVRTREDTAKLTELNQRITSLNDYVDTLQDRDRECLSGPDVERVRNLWNESPGTGNSAAATR